MKHKFIIVILVYKVKGQKRTMYQRILVSIKSSCYVYRHEVKSSIPNTITINK